MTGGAVVRPAASGDLPALLDVHRAAFGSDVEATLVADLLADPGAAPLESFVATVDGDVAAHVLLTSAQVESAPSLVTRILAPLAVRPEHQGHGLGTAVTAAALDAARDAGVAVVVVLGHPTYYPRFGFRPLLPLGPTPPFPIDPAHTDAWQVLDLRGGTGDAAGELPVGPVRTATALLAPEMWLP